MRINIFLIIFMLMVQCELYSQDKDRCNISVTQKMSDPPAGYSASEYVYINPFSPAPNFDLSIPDTSIVTISIIGNKGDIHCQIIDYELFPGIHTIVWNMKISEHKFAPQGMYYFDIDARNMVKNRKPKQRYLAKLRFEITFDL